MKKLIIAYILLWIFPVLAAGMYLLDIIHHDGLLTPFAGVCHGINTVMILVTMTVIYTAIKWFDIKSIRKDIENDDTRCIVWQMRRVVMLFATVFVCLLAYYLTLDDAGLYCTLITLVAATMCYPQRTRRSHHIRELSEKDKA